MKEKVINKDSINIKNFFWLIFIFLISRIIIYNYFQIKINTPNYGYHLLDISLLRDDLFNSLFFFTFPTITLEFI